MYAIKGQFNKKSSYDISFLVHENGYPGTNAWNGKITSEAEAICKYTTCQHTTSINLLMLVHIKKLIPTIYRNKLLKVLVPV